jgi:hypothetical protein
MTLPNNGASIVINVFERSENARNFSSVISEVSTIWPPKVESINKVSADHETFISSLASKPIGIGSRNAQCVLELARAAAT